LHRETLTEGTVVPSFYCMSQTNTTHHLESLIRSAFEEGRCGEYYLVDLETSSSGHITAYIDGDEGVSLDACTQISRILESILDEEPTLGGIYTLEVSSPGVSRPLKFPRQYLKHVGRTLRIQLVNGEHVEGELKTTSHDAVTLEVPSKEKKGKPEMKEIAFAEIDEAYVTVSFKK
jgi:ribosome maturation factor RimP